MVTPTLYLKKVRSQLLTPKLAPTSRQDPILLIATFCNAAGPIRTIIKKHWKVLIMDPDLTPHIGPTPQITYRRGKSIIDYVVQSHFILTPARIAVVWPASICKQEKYLWGLSPPDQTIHLVQIGRSDI